MAIVNAYEVGQVVTLTGTFTNAAGVAADPTAITLYIKVPTGAITTLTYAGSDLTKIGTGVYTYNFAIAMSGRHWYRYVGTGAVVAASESSLDVKVLQTV